MKWPSGRLGDFSAGAGEFARFGVVGALAFVVDIGAANAMWALLGEDEGHLTGKAVSAVMATTFSYVANRQWTYRHRERTGPLREYTLFVLVNMAAVLLSLCCLAVTVYLLGLDSLLAKNLSANVIGVALGTAFRFWAYRRWVFGPPVRTHTHAAVDGPFGGRPVTRGPVTEKAIKEGKEHPDAHPCHRGSRVHRLPVRTRGTGR
ncbi:GtrA family protein [Streptomyces acidicola]|uniref:GtrA family protein n=1 Tax=Streptomyces acidicola TaxID=2596892 RepID=UPI003817A5AB